MRQSKIAEAAVKQCAASLHVLCCWPADAILCTTERRGYVSGVPMSWRACPEAPQLRREVVPSQGVLQSNR